MNEKHIDKESLEIAVIKIKEFVLNDLRLSKSDARRAVGKTYQVLTKELKK